jgi:hypothetical protein
MLFERGEGAMRSIMFAAAFAASIGLAGCQSTQETSQHLQSNWVGKSSDDFFIKHGAPIGAFALADGGAIYTWDGARTSVYVPSVPITNTSYVGTVPVTTTSWSGNGSIAVACAVQIVTDKDRKITEIRATKDSIGMWQLSRCAEVFGTDQ